MKKNALIPALLVTAALTVSACGGSDAAAEDGAAATVKVTVKDMQFSPAVVEIEQGQTVEWVFEDGGMPHDVEGDDLSALKSDLLTTGSYTYTFDETGEFGYHCNPHPDMTGAVVVSG